MTTSSTYSTNLEIVDFFDESFERAGIDPASLTQRHIKSARRSLDLMLSEWINKGVLLWAVDQQTITMVDGTATYETPVGTVAVLDMVWRDSVTLVDTPINPMSRDEYLAIPKKTTEGIVSRYWLERAQFTISGSYPLGTPRIHFWCTPDNSLDSVIYYRMRSLQDAGAGSNTLDIPPRWQEAVAAGLAAKLAVKFGPTRIGPLKGEAANRFAEAKQEERERTPSNLRVKYNTGLRSGR
jgi:hypothetical protein